MRQVIIFETDYERGLTAETLANDWIVAHPTVDIINASLATTQYGAGSVIHQSICILYDINGFDLAMGILRERF